MVRLRTTTGSLARRGFTDTAAADTTLAAWGDDVADALIDPLGAAADPDLALAGLARLAEKRPTLPAELADHPTWAAQLVSVLGASAALQQHLFHHVAAVDLLREKATRASAAYLRETFAAAAADTNERALADNLRIVYKNAVVRIAARDLCADDPSEILPDIAAELSDAADAVFEATLSIARREVGEPASHVRLAIVALGKCGAQELNYVSDVDVLYVAEPAVDDDGNHVVSVDAAVQTATDMVAIIARICSAHTSAGTIWQVDAALRPEGKAGPLVRTLASMRAYYEKWAKDWEFQAMLKARPAAGDRELGQEFVSMVAPLVWVVGENPHFVAEVQAMRKRVVSLIPAKDAKQEIKLGEGGLRDVEFTVQLLQLVHGRHDDRLHHTGTLSALTALIDNGYVGRRDGHEFAAAYRLERSIEHRVQLYRMRRTHLMPTSPTDLRRLGRSLGWRRDAESELAKAWLTAKRQVLSLHRRLFYSPLLEAVGKLKSDELQLSASAALDRLHALGYADPKSALQHIEALTSGSSRTAEIQRQLLPAMLGWFAEGANPDAGLLAFRQVSEQLGSTSWYLRALRDEGAMAQRLAHILTASRYAADLLKRAPEVVQMLADEADLVPRDRDQLVRQMAIAARRHDGPAKQMEAIRAIRRRELFRIVVGDILGILDVDQVGMGLSDVAAATIEIGLDAVSVAARERLGEPLPPISIIAMGRWGGREMSYASDADVMFVIADGASEEATTAASEAITQLRSLLVKGGSDPGLALDADLRPEGKGGPMVRSVGAYLSYYDRWSATWEAQALLRAAHGAGDLAIGAQILDAVGPLRYPKGGLSDNSLAEIRKLKARMESERLPRGHDSRRNTKLGPGSLSDVEWTVQLLQLQHGHDIADLRTTRTLPALQAAVDHGLITADDGAALREAWLFSSRVRNRIMLVRGRASDSFSSDFRELAAVAELMGYGPQGSSHLLDDYRKVTRHCRAVVDRLLWGLD